MQDTFPRARLEFAKDTKARLERLALEAINKTKPQIKNPGLTKDDINDFVEAFVGTLEAFADGIPGMLELYPPKQQKRRETVRSLGTALQRSIDAYLELDSGVKRYVFSKAMDDLSKTHGAENPFPNNYQTGRELYENEAGFIFDLQIIAKSIQSSADEMPNRKDEPIESMIARALEGLFFDYGIPFTTSETSFTAECMRAVLALGGIEKDRVDYWLTQAKKHPDSITGLVNKYRKSNDKTS
ncbi:hypothetical protein [Methylomonas methanica]|uniref:Uncharacterized protein n=1 Tax=Methylomonas methanica TaxID=421 RepID=A0A177MAT3_METMH|nr:hypothetical protein [Methylomonas methanica]OAI02857.1 hypothetical protein A1332_02880 [Methylomonas methanica]